MRVWKYLFLVIFSLAFCSSAFPYDVPIAADISVDEGISHIAVDPAGEMAFGIGSSTGSLYIMEMLTNTLIGNIPLEIVPSGIIYDSIRNELIISSKEGVLYFHEPSGGNLLRIMSLGGAISAVAFNKDIDRLFIGDGSSLRSLDLKTGKVINEISMPAPVTGIDTDSKLGYLVLIMEGQEQLSVYNLTTLERVSEINTGNFPLALSVNLSTHMAILTNKADASLPVELGGRLTIISLEDKMFSAAVPFYGEPLAVAIDHLDNTALITHKKGVAVVKLENPVPAINTLVPNSASAEETGFVFSIRGNKFVRGSKAVFDTNELSSTFEDNSNIKAYLPLSELKIPRDVFVRIINPVPGGGISNPLKFQIYNPVPSIDYTTPDTLFVNSPSFTIKVYGKNFMNGSVVKIAGRDMKTRFVSSILLQADLLPSFAKTSGDYPVTVVNPMPDAFSSNSVNIYVREDSKGAGISSSANASPSLPVLPAGKLSGRIINTDKEPVEGVTLRIKNKTAVTDAEGNFLFENLPAGKQQLMINGATAKNKDARYPILPVTVDIKPGLKNDMPFQVYLHKQKKDRFTEIKPNEDTILTDPDIPGFEMRIPKGVKITGWDGIPNKRVNVKKVPADRLPVKPLPANSFVRSVYMFYFDKAGGGIPDRPIPVKSPNDLGLLPGEKAVLWYYDESPIEGEAPNDWAIAGTGTVTADGLYIVADAGGGIPKFCCGAVGWGGSGAETAPAGKDGERKCGTDYFFVMPFPSGLAGDPVDISTGFFVHSVTDLYIPGTIPINIKRYYRIGSNSAGSFGRNSYFEYDWWVGSYGADGQINNTNPTMLLLIKPGNFQYRFSIQPDGSFVNTSDPLMAGNIFTNTAGIKSLKMTDGMVYTFNAEGNLAEIADKNNNKLTFERNTSFLGGEITRITSTDGRVITFNQHIVSFRNRIDSIVDNTGRTIQYTYEDNVVQSPQLTRVTYPDMSTVQYQYDVAGRMNGIINRDGILEVFNEYDINDRVIRQTQPGGGVFQFNYTSAGGYITETSMTYPNGALSTWRFNNWSYITDITTPDGVIVYEREPGTNRVLSITDPLLRRTSYTYDAKGRVIGITDNAGNTTQYTYEDLFNNITGVTNAIGNSTLLDYDAKGNVTSFLMPDGQSITISYNLLGKPVSVTDQAGNVTSLQYDTSGNLTTITDPMGSIQSLVYNNLNRIIRFIDPNGGITSYSYDAAERLSSITDGIGNITNYTYTPGGKVLSVIDGRGQSLKYSYDANGRVSSLINQLGAAVTYSYNINGNITSLTDRKGQTTTYTYDISNRITRTDFADGSYITYSYDAGGRLLTITDSISGPISYSYSGAGCGPGCDNTFDRVIQEITPQAR